MSKYSGILIVFFILFGCTKTEPLTISDFYHLIYNAGSTFSFDEDNIHLYTPHFNVYKKLAGFGLVTVEARNVDLHNKSIRLLSQKPTQMGLAVINKISRNKIKSPKIPVSIVKQINNLEADIAKKYKLTLSQYIFLTKLPSGDISAPRADIFISRKNDIELVKTLSRKGLMKYSIIDDTLNGKPAKSFRWWKTQKGLELKMNN